MTTSFFVPRSLIREHAYVTLPEDEAHHAVRVLRKRPGDEIVVVDGEGGWYRVRLEQVDRRVAAGSVLEARRDVGEPPYELSIGLAVLKNRNRYETFLEKAVELGVCEVLPLLTRRTEKGGIRLRRAENVLIAAMKQSGRCRMTRLCDPVRFTDAINGDSLDLALIAHERADPSCTVTRLLERRPDVRRIRILVGPEGGFTDEEVEAAVTGGYVPVSFGPRRLRAETAALVAASAVMLACS